MHSRAVALGAATLLTTAGLLLSGCSAFPAGFPSPTGSGSPSPSDTSVPIGAPFGDVAPRESITDDEGTYLHVTLSPTAAVATAVDPATVGASIAGSSWDDDALLDAQRFVATFVAEQTIDSTALDADEAGWESWLDSTAAQYFGPNPEDAIGRPTGGIDRPTPIFNDPNNTTPVLVRDGLARLDDATITVDSLENDPREGGERLMVSGTADVSYRLSDEAAIAALLEQGYDQETIDGFPDLLDGKNGHFVTHFAWSYSVERVGGGWLIRSYELTSDSNIEGVSQA